MFLPVHEVDAVGYFCRFCYGIIIPSCLLYLYAPWMPPPRSPRLGNEELCQPTGTLNNGPSNLPAGPAPRFFPAPFSQKEAHHGHSRELLTLLHSPGTAAGALAAQPNGLGLVAHRIGGGHDLAPSRGPWLRTAFGGEGEREREREMSASAAFWVDDGE